MALFTTVSVDSIFRRGVRAAETDYVPPTREITQTTARPAPQGPSEARFESDRWARPKQPPTVAAFVPVVAPLPARKLAEREQARAALKKHEQHGGRFSKVYGAQRSRDIEVPWLMAYQRDRSCKTTGGVWGSV